MHPGRSSAWIARTLGLCFLCELLASGSVCAQPTAIEARAQPGVVIGAKVGAGLGAPVNSFGLGYTLELELGYLLPLPAPVRHALQLFASGAYAGTTKLEGTTPPDMRLPADGVGHYTLLQRTASLTLGVLGRIPVPSERLAPYVAVGYRGYWLATESSGHVGASSFGPNTERAYEHALFGAAGLELFVGPGALLGELQLSYARHDAYVLRDAGVGGLRFMLGYRLIIGGPAGPSQGAEQTGPTVTASVPEPTREPPPPSASQEVSAADAAALQGHGQIRGNVRSFDGAPLRATVNVQPGDLSTSTDALGEFSLDVSPGRYHIKLEAQGYRAQERDAVVDENGITVLNVELKKKKK